MVKAKAYVVYGLGEGCHEEVLHAYSRAGAISELIHFRELISTKKLFESQILNLSGGFFHGDIGGAGMCAANEIEHALINSKKFKDLLLEYIEKGGIVYGQCNGFQVLVKTGLLPGIDNDYSKQTVTLTTNDCGVYRVDPVLHKIQRKHFAFERIDHLWLWCRHGEGKIQFYTDSGLISKEEGEENRKKVNEGRVLLRYIHKENYEVTEKFPHSPNGSVDGIAGLVNSNGHIFAHMGHTEVGVYKSSDPRFFRWKDDLRRQGVKAADLDEKKLEGMCLQIYKNIVNYFK